MKSIIPHPIERTRQVSLPLYLLIALLLNALALPSQSQPPMLEIEMGSKTDLGLPIYWSSQEGILLHQDGGLRFLKTNELDTYRISKIPFEPIASMSLKGKLQEEYGKGYEVQTSGPYLFVVPAGSTSSWAERFQMLSASFTRFLSTRGLAIHPPEFPLVTVVFRSVAEFQRQGRQDEAAIGPSTLGYYSIVSNRMYLFDRPVPPEAWFSTNTTILHEATHQLAFNSGVHQRLSQTPLWVVEGLASLFEAEAYFDPKMANRKSKINLARQQSWSQLSKNSERTAQLISTIVQDDRLFESSPDEAYAIAWAMTYYLSEREGSKYSAYLRQLANLKPNLNYSKPQRLADFRNAFRSDMALLARSIDRSFAE